MSRPISELIYSEVFNGGTVSTTEVAGRTHLIRTGAQGRHFAETALCALAAAAAVGLDPVTAALDLVEWSPRQGRGLQQTIEIEGELNGQPIILIDDAFNANPTSLSAALDTLASMKTGRTGIERRVGRRVAVLGDMLELGSDEIGWHLEIAITDQWMRFPLYTVRVRLCGTCSTRFRPTSEVAGTRKRRDLLARPDH